MTIEVDTEANKRPLAKSQAGPGRPRKSVNKQPEREKRGTKVLEEKGKSEFDPAWLDPRFLAQKIREEGKVLNYNGTEGTEIFSLQRLQERGVDFPTPLHVLIGKIGVVTDRMLGFPSSAEGERSNLEVLRHQYQTVILLAKGLNFGKRSPQNIGKGDLDSTVPHLVTDALTKTILMEWRPRLTRLVREGKL